MRGMYTDAILMAIAQRPGIRAVEIADKVDCDIELVEASIKEEIAAGNVRREVVTGPNTRPTVAFWMKGVSSVVSGPVAPKVASLPSPAPTQKAAPAAPKAAVPAPVPAVAVTPPDEPALPEAIASQPTSVPEPEISVAHPSPVAAPAGKTKVDICMDFILNQPDHTATDDDFRALLGLRRDQHPSVYLSTQRKKGEIHKDMDIWRLGRRKTIASTAAPDAAAINPDADFRCALWSDGELQLARGEQIAMRLSAAEVGRLRSYLAGGSAP